MGLVVAATWKINAIKVIVVIVVIVINDMDVIRAIDMAVIKRILDMTLIHE